ncbi:Protein CBG22602 [Caenorhabditis briggsae]|uniref:Protein CBG22602 n=1 Tax=Caenorhabditis briggsae TaxID=6238 RepID=A8Y2N1_CAEBR|nr:Protein CBG22602 [Caenorhabditis briggsae]CAP39156.1 Protein CBG22602 [Caenorhabditis briggsae]
MYINWAHHYIPKFSGALSFFINILFILIVHDDKKSSLIFGNADDERRLYMKQIFWENFKVDTFDMNTIICVYNNASSRVIRNSFIAIFYATTMSTYSMAVCIIFGTLTIRKLQSLGNSMSDKTKNLQKRLMYALIVQSSIPIVICYCPCITTWYLPVFKLDIGSDIFWISSVAISFFPVFDPLALFYFMPVFRTRLKEIFLLKEVTVGPGSSGIT